MSTTPRQLADRLAALARENWNREPAVLAGHQAPVLTEREILETVDCGLLCWPYFSVLRDGVALPAAGLTTNRRVLNVAPGGYVHRGALLEQLRAGATLRLDQLEDWHPRVRPLVDRLRGAFDARVSASVLLTPAGGPSTAPATAPAGHVLAVQLEGEAEWTPVPPAEEDGADPAPPLRAAAGDLLYVPRGWAYRVAPVGGTALHLAVVVQTPTVQDVLGATLRELKRRIGATEQAARHHLVSPAEKSRWVRDLVLEYCTEPDPSAVGETALTLCRSRS
ncbi:JmjC domain-containing protein [Actinophytocola xanthii]|uniref:JmjC domain-containing protein n=1 Tax=Actinophytocola xanthii TaxID=1912961 RepID=A0A1Q8CAE1_9PSEU|nr:cupin domain-containing protein [Actinophytocola xanthii]OLF11292.1 hypothetical protein BU204_30690 [Actinophytocola xanthii]